MRIGFRVNSELANLCHFWREDPANASLSEDELDQVPLIALLPGDFEMLQRQGYKKGDSIMITFDERWKPISWEKGT